MALTKIPGELFSVGDLDISDVGTISLDAIEGDADSNTSITFSGSDVITIATGGSNRLTIGDGALSPVTDNQIDLGTSSLEFKDAFFDGTVTSDAFAGPLTGDVTGNVSGTAATVTGAAQSNITSLGTLTTLTVDNVIVNGTTIGHTSDTDLMTLADGVLTVAGEVDATSLDISGDVDVDGTLETDNLTVGGAQGSDGQVLTSTGSGVAWEDASSFNADAAQTFNDSGAAVDFRIESDSDANMFFLDGSANAIGMGTSTPNESGFQSGSRVLTIQGAAADDFGVIELLSTDTTSSNRIGEIRFGNMDATDAPVGLAGIRARRAGADNSTDLSFWTNNAGTFVERMTVGNDGPVVTISDEGGNYEDMLKLLRTNASANEAGFVMHLTGSGGTGQAVSMYCWKGEDWSSGTSRSAGLTFQAKDDGTDQNMYAFGNFSDGVNQHKFYTEGAERLRIDQNGVILIGTTSAISNSVVTVHGGDMMVKGDNNSCGISDLLPGYTRGDYGVIHSTANHVYFSVGSSYVSYINGGNGTFNVSDQRLKENVATLTGSLNKVKQLRGVSFTWKDTEERGTDTAIGLIAQEVEAVYPELVDDGGLPKDNEGNDPLKSVNYAHLTSVLIEAVKELSTELEAAKARITTLEG